MIGLGIGVGWATKRRLVNYINELIKQFKDRVAADGGTFEAEQCLKNSLPALIENEPSLCVTPNAVEEGKLFSIIPTDGSGDMDVVRATTATLVNSEGVIEDCPYNLIKYSEQFENTSWIKQSTTIVQDFAISPNGTEDADLCYPNSDGNFRGFRQLNTTSTGLRAKSIFAKQSGKSKFFIRFDNSAYVTFDLENGTIFQNTTEYVATIEDYGNGWYRCYAQSNIETSATSMYIGITDSSGYPSVTANGTDGILFWGAQDESGLLKEYFPTTDRLNVPRLDYTNGSCPSILVEPQRTNLALRSEEFNISSIWSASSGVTVLANQGIAPNGNMTMDLITFPSISTFITQGISVASGATYTFSVWLATQSGTQTVEIGNINLNTWQSVTVTTTPQRFEVTQVASGATRFLGIRCTAAYSIFAWGAQLEAGANATSYIPTVASAVTRNADVISKSGLSGITTITETFEDDTTNVISGSPTSYTMSEGRIKNVIGL
jgi:hypothetical protein